jgi:polysaccharide pyruvyl transferase WcaK-like protein
MNLKMNRKIPTECVTWRWHGNLGDDLIFAAQVAMFGEVLEFGQYLALPECLLVGGGTFIPKRLDPPWLVELSRQVPTALFGTGACDPLFWGRDEIPQWLEVLANARFIGVRGPLSKERLETWGVPSHRIEVVGDSALWFAGVEDIPQACQGRLAVNVAWTYGKLYGFNQECVEKVVIVVLKELLRSGWDITPVCAWQPDDEVFARISAEVVMRSVEHWHDDYNRALTSVKNFDVVIAEKLHVAVLAACKGVPFIAINYRSKVRDFCRSIGWEQFCVDTEHLEPDKILSLIDTLVQCREKHCHELRQKVSGARERLLKAVPHVISALTQCSMNSTPIEAIER